MRQLDACKCGVEQACLHGHVGEIGPGTNKAQREGTMLSPHSFEGDQVWYISLICLDSYLLSVKVFAASFSLLSASQWYSMQDIKRPFVPP